MICPVGSFGVIMISILLILKCLYKNVVIRLNILLYAMKGLDDGDFDYF